MFEVIGVRPEDEVHVLSRERRSVVASPIPDVDRVVAVDREEKRPTHLVRVQGSNLASVHGVRARLVHSHSLSFVGTAHKPPTLSAWSRSGPQPAIWGTPSADRVRQIAALASRLDERRDVVCIARRIVQHVTIPALSRSKAACIFLVAASSVNPWSRGAHPSHTCLDRRQQDDVVEPVEARAGAEQGEEPGPDHTVVHGYEPAAANWPAAAAALVTIVFWSFEPSSHGSMAPLARNRKKASPSTRTLCSAELARIRATDDLPAPGGPVNHEGDLTR